ncbi:MAG TPA: alginate lyase family protein, partial [Bauldia sp.]|nr:alginate lyase family protein [Bauldia sp.]
PVDHAALKAAYAASPLAAEPDTFVLYRIVGNDLAPRHAAGQSLANVRFILENEPALDGCEKRWLVNRIVDPGAEAAILALLAEHRQPVLRIPFYLADYARIPFAVADFSPPGFLLSAAYDALDEDQRLRADVQARRLKNLYAMNNNGARNAALADGRGRAKWVLPFDGNCFVTAEAWHDIRAAVVAAPYLPYFVVPMARSRDNADLLSPGYRPAAAEEPQVAFRRDAAETFDERQPYGRRPKVDLLWRLGVPGPWRAWKFDPWDLPPGPLSPDAGRVGEAGWVARLTSGVQELETERKSFRDRGSARAHAIVTTIDMLDWMAVANALGPDRLAVYDPARIEALGRDPSPLADQLRREAGLLSAGDAGAAASPEALAGDIAVLALAARAFGDRAAGERAAGLIRRRFVDPVTAVPPDSAGAIAATATPVLLDAVRLLAADHFLGAADLAALRAWFRERAAWLGASPEGRADRRAIDRRGTLHDLEVAAIAAWLGDPGGLAAVMYRAEVRLHAAFGGDGIRSAGPADPADAGLLDLAAWTALARVLSACGVDLWSRPDADRPALRDGLRRIAATLAAGKGSGPDGEALGSRLQPFLADLAGHGGAAGIAPDAGAPVPRFPPEAGIPPWWMLRRD